MKFSEQKCPKCGEVDYKILYKQIPNIDGEIYWHVICTFRLCGHHFSILAETVPAENNPLQSK